MGRRPFAAITVLTLAACALTTTGPVGVPAGAAAPLTKFNGASSDRAAPSCWAIKQSFPSSRDGLYWLLTPTLVRPQIFYCDMTTSGGGWVLIGRGRDNWAFNYAGQGTAAQVALAPNGTSAFTPATLPSATVDGLFDGRAVSTSYDGFRLRRATNSAGTAWQESRIHFAFLKSFTWEWHLGQPLTTVTFGANTKTVGPKPTHYEGSTYDARIDSAWQLLHTGLLPNHYARKGFAYGSSVKGSSSANSYMWTSFNGGSYALPFTQVFVRPRFGDADLHFTKLPASGVGAQALPPIPRSTPQKMDWGVGTVQKPASDPDPDGDALVYGLAQIGNTMFVGGKFAQVLHHSTNTHAEQPWLAAFDARTGVWVRDFLPQLDGAVFDLAATPDGKLLVAGNFTSVNSVANTAGLALLDPATGAPVGGWQASLAQPKYAAPRAYARSIAVKDNWVYVTGGFKQIAGVNQTLTTGGIGRVSLTDGEPDVTWHPYANLTPMDIQPSSDGTRVYVAGDFTTMGTTGLNGAAGTYDDGVAVLDPTTGVADTSFVSQHNTDGQHGQLAVTETPTRFVHGGQQWWLAGYDSTDLSFVRSAVEQPHGDIQVATYGNGLLFAGCHCNGQTYTDLPNQYTRADSINWLGAWNPTTLDRVPSFKPLIGTTAEGVWEIAFDADQCLWAGGDINHGPTTNDWLSGFARFCPGDTTPPTAPGPLSVHDGKIWWNRSSDTGSTPSYELIRNDRVVAMTADNRIAPFGHGVYYVRAIDSAGNRSATTKGIWV